MLLENVDHVSIDDYEYPSWCVNGKIPFEIESRQQVFISEEAK